MLTDAGLEVAGVAGDAAQLLQLVAAQLPGVVLADIRMPPTQTTEGLEAAVEIRRRWPGTAVIVLSQHVETEHLFELLAGDAERRRLERDLHDGAQQRLVTLTLALGMARSRVAGVDPELEALIEAAGKEAKEALTELRELARGIHPRCSPRPGWPERSRRWSSGHRPSSRSPRCHASGSRP